MQFSFLLLTHSKPIKPCKHYISFISFCAGFSFITFLILNLTLSCLSVRPQIKELVSIPRKTNRSFPYHHCFYNHSVAHAACCSSGVKRADLEFTAHIHLETGSRMLTLNLTSLFLFPWPNSPSWASVASLWRLHDHTR
jgi:hypothetical protein